VTSGAVRGPAGAMRLIIADDSLLARAGLGRILAELAHEVVAAEPRGERLPAMVAEFEPDAVILDVRMPPTQTTEGLQLAATLRSRHPRVGVLVLCQYVVAEYATQLLEHDAAGMGYLLKERLHNPVVLDDALRRVAAGGTVVDPALVSVLLERQRRIDPLAPLTNRERDVLRLMAEGRTNHGIADELKITLNTVSTHVQHVFDKLGLPDTTADNRRVLAVLAFLQADD
jgi:DNA-binding NarL/FixJ family response regulator